MAILAVGGGIIVYCKFCRGDEGGVEERIEANPEYGREASYYVETSLVTENSVYGQGDYAEEDTYTRDGNEEYGGGELYD